MHNGCTLWFTGMSGSGKSTVSGLLASRLQQLGAKVEVLDGDVVRTRLSRGLGFSREDREENIRRIGFVCELLSRNGVITIVAAISPYCAGRSEIRALTTNFVEIYMKCPLEVLISRDVKGLYKKAIAGEIPQFTGISDPYEPPTAPEVAIDSSLLSPEQSVEILSALDDLGLLPADRASAPDLASLPSEAKPAFS
jgi:adenylyl-sulfate kinase